MARKPRIEFAGACYHVLNRGNYRRDLFETAGAAQAFVDCLGETCERMGWQVHAYCLLRNHYHFGAGDAARKFSERCALVAEHVRQSLQSLSR